MAEYLLLFAILFGLLAALMQADFVLTLVYLLLGVFLVGRWWSRRASGSIQVSRVFPHRVFSGERIQVALSIQNRGILPVVWLQLQESLPAELSLIGLFRQVISLGPYGRSDFQYMLEGRKRGYYAVGPLLAHSGDLFGLAGEQSLSLKPDYLTVYPRIIPFVKVTLPSRSPLGALRYQQPIFEDPSRVKGKRDYIPGDSLRRVDWKSSATTGRLQVKLFEPSIALETAIFLNLHSDEYDYKTRFDSTELAIVVAASLANYITNLRQPVGLWTNGRDPLEETRAYPLPIPPRRGRGHLMRILDILARVTMGNNFPFVDLLRKEMVHLTWGTTILILSAHIDDALFESIFATRRAGLNPVLLPCGLLPFGQETRKRAEHFNIPFYHILHERDLDMWRQ